jgi:hypothetical protein
MVVERKMKRIVIKDGHSHIIYKRQLKWMLIWWTLERRWYNLTHNQRLEYKIEKARRAGYKIVDKRKKAGEKIDSL